MEVVKTGEKYGIIYVVRKVECGLLSDDNAQRKWKSCSQVEKKAMADGSEHV